MTMSAIMHFITDHPVMMIIAAIVLLTAGIVIYNLPVNRYQRKCKRNVYSKLSTFDMDVTCRTMRDYKQFNFQQYLQSQLAEMDAGEILTTLYDVEEAIWTEFKALSQGQDEKLIQKMKRRTKRWIDNLSVFVITCQLPAENANQKDISKQKVISMHDIFNYEERDYDHLLAVEESSSDIERSDSGDDGPVVTTDDRRVMKK